VVDLLRGSADNLLGRSLPCGTTAERESDQLWSVALFGLLTRRFGTCHCSRDCPYLFQPRRV